VREPRRRGMVERFDGRVTPPPGLMCFPAWCQASLGYRWIPLYMASPAETLDMGGSSLGGYRKTRRIGQTVGTTGGSHARREAAPVRSLSVPASASSRMSGRWDKRQARIPRSRIAYRASIHSPGTRGHAKVFVCSRRGAWCHRRRDRLGTGARRYFSCAARVSSSPSTLASARDDQWAQIEVFVFPRRTGKNPAPHWSMP
jgi:hypothetical protein